MLIYATDFSLLASCFGKKDHLCLTTGCFFFFFLLKKQQHLQKQKEDFQWVCVKTYYDYHKNSDNKPWAYI